MHDLLEYDRDHVWHPYASALTPSPALFVERATGVRLTVRDLDGTRELIDGMSSWWCAIHGYGVPELDAAATTQLARMSHVMFGGLTHEPAITLARTLIDLAPGEQLQHVFFADSGSVSVEVAMKMAWQKFAAAGTPRTKLFTVRGGYHGDTLSPMSVCDPVGGMHTLFTGVLPPQIFAPIPPTARVPEGQSHSPVIDDPAEYEAWARETKALFREHADDIAGVIVEPLLQGAGGMRVWPVEAVQLLADLARESGALLIFDEIATGFGRTGTMWAADQCGVVPDVMCIGKALTGGYLTMAAVLCTSAVAEAVSAEPAGALMHGPTFMANPLACAIASASIDLLTNRGLESVTRINRGLSDGLAPCRDLPNVIDVRTIGAVGVVQLDRPVEMIAASRAAQEHGVWLRPFRDLIYTMPPYVCTDDDIASITTAVTAAAKACA